jgi:hypothetical protein
MRRFGGLGTGPVTGRHDAVLAWLPIVLLVGLE